jgi:hypothetical protein
VEHQSATVERLAALGRLSEAQLVDSALLASRPAVKISVPGEGWYRMGQRELFAAGLNAAADPRNLQLLVDGEQQRMIVRGEEDGRFDPEDYVEFYGTGLDSPYSERRVYWLQSGDQPGLRVEPVKSDGVPSAAQSFTATVERQDRSIYFAALRNGEQENFFGAVIASQSIDQQLTLSHPGPAGSEKAELEINLQGVTFDEHRVNVYLNESSLGEVRFNGQFQGSARFGVPHSLLREGANTVRLEPIGVQGSVSLVDSIRISYQHGFRADNDALRLSVRGGEQVTIDGFTTKGIRVFDVTDTSSPQELLGEVLENKIGYSIRIATPGKGQREVLAFAGQPESAVATPNLPSSLGNLNASYLIISTRELGAALGPLVELRKRQGLTPAIIDIEDIYDEFSWGQKTPYAVSDFLRFAKTTWKKKPRFVVFAGEASYDPKGYLGFGERDDVPTKLMDTDFMETSSDEWFSDFDGDGIGEIATGRMPARTTEELSVMMAKIADHEQTSPGEEVLLVADANDGYDFEQAVTELRPMIPPELRITQVNRGRVDAEMARGSLTEAIYRKQFLVNYVGHGSVNQWRGNLLTNEYALGLRNEHRPFFVMMTCLNGYFHDPALDSLGESLLKAQHGGAVAVWASSGMTMPVEQALVNQELSRLLFSREQVLTIGEAAMKAKSVTTSGDVRRTWVLLGDPAMKLR